MGNGVWSGQKWYKLSVIEPSMCGPAAQAALKDRGSFACLETLVFGLLLGTTRAVATLHERGGQPSTPSDRLALGLSIGCILSLVDKPQRENGARRWARGSSSQNPSEPQTLETETQNPKQGSTGRRALDLEFREAAKRKPDSIGVAFLDAHTTSGCKNFTTIK